MLASLRYSPKGLDALTEGARFHPIWPRIPEVLVDGDGAKVIVPADRIPGMEQKLIPDFTENKAHYHLSFGETYFVIRGSISVALHEKGKDEILIATYHENDVVIIPPLTVHKVFDGSEDNLILVTYAPRFDEKIGMSRRGLIYFVKGLEKSIFLTHECSANRYPALQDL